MPWCSLARTQDRMMKSFSRPWNASTLAISTSCEWVWGVGGEDHAVHRGRDPAACPRAVSPASWHLVELGVQGAAELHVLHKVGPLALVGCDDANLVWLGARL